MNGIIEKSNTSKFFLAAAALGVLCLAGCENVANLYPANDLAENTGGNIAVHFTHSSVNSGTIEAVGPGNELLTGSYGPAPADYKFGDIFKAVEGQFSTNPVHPDQGTPSIATLTGTKGTSMQCEFYNNDATGDGFGGCKSLAGAMYRLQY